MKDMKSPTRICVVLSPRALVEFTGGSLRETLEAIDAIASETREQRERMRAEALADEAELVA